MPSPATATYQWRGRNYKIANGENKYLVSRTRISHLTRTTLRSTPLHSHLRRCVVVTI